MKFKTKDELKDLYLDEGLAAFNNLYKELIQQREGLMKRMYAFIGDEEVLRFLVQNAVLSGTAYKTSAVLLPTDPELINQMFDEIRAQIKMLSFLKHQVSPILNLYKVFLPSWLQKLLTVFSVEELELIQVLQLTFPPGMQDYTIVLQGIDKMLIAMDEIKADPPYRGMEYDFKEEKWKFRPR